MSSSTTPPRHFRPQTARQRLDVLNSIDQIEQHYNARCISEDAASHPAPQPGLSEGTRSARAISEGLRSGSIRLQPEPSTGADTNTLAGDPYLLRSGAGHRHATQAATPTTMPTLRAVSGAQAVHPGAWPARRATPPSAQALRSTPEPSDGAQRLAAALVAAIYIGTLLAVITIVYLARQGQA